MAAMNDVREAGWGPILNRIGSSYPCTITGCGGTALFTLEPLGDVDQTDECGPDESTWAAARWVFICATCGAVWGLTGKPERRIVPLEEVAAASDEEGWIPACQPCQGDGVVLHERDVPEPGHPVQTWETCQVCGGTGKADQ